MQLTHTFNRKKHKRSSRKLLKRKSNASSAFRKCVKNNSLKMKHYSKLKLQKPKLSEPKVSESMKKASSTTANLMLNEGKFRLSTKFSTRTHYFFSADWSK